MLVHIPPPPLEILGSDADRRSMHTTHIHHSLRKACWNAWDFALNKPRSLRCVWRVWPSCHAHEVSGCVTNCDNGCHLSTSKVCTSGNIKCYCVCASVYVAVLNIVSDHNWKLSCLLHVLLVSVAAIIDMACYNLDVVKYSVNKFSL